MKNREKFDEELHKKKKRKKREKGKKRKKIKRREKRGKGTNEGKRNKRDAGDDQLEDFLFGDKDERNVMGEDENEAHVNQDNQPDITVTEKSKVARHDISESLLGESLDHHKIRHIEEKISLLHDNDQLVTAILDKFCVISPCPPTPACNKTTCDQCPAVISKTSCEECDKNRTSSHHFPIHRSHDDSAPPPHLTDEPPFGCIANTEIIVIIVLTSFLNMVFFVFTLLCCRAVSSLKELESDDLDKELLLSQSQFDNKGRRNSWSGDQKDFTILDNYGYVI